MLVTVVVDECAADFASFEVGSVSHLGICDEEVGCSADCSGGVCMVQYLACQRRGRW